jgi:hypothetical protein
MSKKLTDIQNEMLEVLEDTVEYYSEDVSRRGVARSNGDFENCVFLTQDGKKCAVGRYLNKKDLEKISYSGNLDGGIINFYNEYDKCELSTRIVKRLPKNFWKDLQNLHDKRSNWRNPSGLSVVGKSHVESMKNKIIEGIY